MSWRKHYPFQSHFLDVGNGARLHYVDQGQGPTLLLSHGNPTWSFLYRKLIRAWAHDFRVIAVDHLGCGLSDKPPQYDYHLAGHTDNLLRLIDSLTLSSVTIVGHDWGGAIGLNAVRRQPDNFARIVLFNTGAFPPPRVPWRIAVCRLPLLGPLAVRGGNLFARAALRMALADPHKLSVDERRGMLAPYNNWQHRIGIQRFVDDIPLSGHHRTHRELAALEAALPNMRHLPALLMWGMRDWCFDEACLQRFERVWPEAQIVRFENAGHWVMEDVPEQVIETSQQFLAQRPAHQRQTSSSELAH